LRNKLLDHISLGDLIDSTHGRIDVSQQATRDLNQITHVASCLYESFGRVLPEVRLAWAERLSQFDAPLNLRNLSDLPRWGEKMPDGEDLIPFVERREMQTLVDWLYQRVDPLNQDAVSIMHDLIRVCILLASHAPVKQIINGHVHQPVTVRPGSVFDLKVDVSKIRVGMSVLIQAANNLAVDAVVDDLSAERAAARVLRIYDKSAAADPAPVNLSARLDANAPAQFAEPEVFAQTAFSIGARFSR
jgi:hypothetical protein